MLKLISWLVYGLAVISLTNDVISDDAGDDDDNQDGRSTASLVTLRDVS